jgi:glucose/arabinose dehydrogenase
MRQHPSPLPKVENSNQAKNIGRRLVSILIISTLLAWLISNVNFAQRTLVPLQVSGSSMAFQQIASGLTNPVVIANAGDGSGRLFIVEQAGRIRIYQNNGILATPFLDISANIEAGSEKGLLGLAFHPSYATNRRFFVNYTVRISGQLKTRVSEFLATLGNPNIADPNSESVILEFNQPFDNHNAGDIKFGLDGYLYITSGDGGSGGDPQNNAQNLNTLLGKILRIDINNGSPYTIPPTNPFVDGDPATRDEIWSYGWRNPWRFSFDRLTGDMFIGDVGEGSWEELNYEPAGTGGRNYGWRITEGAHCFNPSSGCNMTGLTLPILEYSHTSGCAVTGGFRYRGTHFPDLYGYYLYADYCSGRIWGATFDGSWTTTELVDTPYFISTFGEDEAGEIYFVNHHSGGPIYRIVPTSTAPRFRVERTWGHVYADGAYFCGLASACFNSSIGADIAERIYSLETLEPGDVIELDSDHPGYLRKSRARSALAIGVISTQPGLIMANHTDSKDNRPAIALIGRVPVKATTENGPIRLGDLLTPASTAGSAMRCDLPCLSPVLGKALGPLRTDKGLVLILVMRP